MNTMQSIISLLLLILLPIVLLMALDWLLAQVESRK